MHFLIISNDYFIVFIGFSVFHCLHENDYWNVYRVSDVVPLLYVCYSRLECIRIISYSHFPDYLPF